MVVDDGTQYVYGVGASPLEHVTSGGTYYHLPDGLGSTLVLVTGSGSVVQAYQYDVFGAVTGSSGHWRQQGAEPESDETAPTHTARNDTSI